MKITNFLFIISLLITFSYAVKVEELSKSTTNTEAELQSMAELELGETTELATGEEEEVEASGEWPQNYFVGHWRMLGYRCPGDNKDHESCDCKMEGKIVICTKVIGDDCVTSGHETFRTRSSIPSTLKTGGRINIRYVVGNRRRPNSGHWNNSMKIVDQNKFVSQNRHYIREPAIVPHPVAPVAPVVVAPVAPVPVAIPTIAVPTVVPAPVIPAQRMVYYYTNYFLGNWNGVGYTCDAHTPAIEVVNIRYNAGRLYATKLLGDNCVPAQKLSFEAPIPGKLWQGLNFACKLVVGSPQHPAARQTAGQIKIIDINTFELGKHTFYRVMGPNAAHPHGVYLNMTPLVGKGAYPGPGFIKMNPKRNMRSPVRRFVIVEEETNKPGNC